MVIMKKKTYPKKCNVCGYSWFARLENPKECPRCKYRFDYKEGRKQSTLRKCKRNMI